MQCARLVSNSLYLTTVWPSLQDAVLHMQCSVPPDCVDTFMVNGVLIAAVQAPEHDVIMEQCLDILDERGLAWDATTWRLVFRLQASMCMRTAYPCKLLEQQLW